MPVQIPEAIQHAFEAAMAALLVRGDASVATRITLAIRILEGTDDSESRVTDVINRLFVILKTPATKALDHEHAGK